MDVTTIVRELNVRELVACGFLLDDARRALDDCAGSVNAAAVMLMSSAAAATPDGLRLPRPRDDASVFSPPSPPTNRDNSSTLLSKLGGDGTSSSPCGRTSKQSSARTRTRKPAVKERLGTKSDVQVDEKTQAWLLAEAASRRHLTHAQRKQLLKKRKAVGHRKSTRQSAAADGDDGAASCALPGDVAMTRALRSSRRQAKAAARRVEREHERLQQALLHSRTDMGAGAGAGATAAAGGGQAAAAAAVAAAASEDEEARQLHMAIEASQAAATAAAAASKDEEARQLCKAIEASLSPELTMPWHDAL
jgi:hypothetical protein